jgi:uncharacterized protein
VEDELQRAHQLFAEYDGELAKLLPGADIFDAHVHLGNDIDGMRGSYDELEKLQSKYGITRSFMFCLDEPDREPGFQKANDRTLAHAARSDGRLIPFVRLDLSSDPIEEAVRVLDAGARGIKLHPRAQRFLLTDDRLAPIFELAAERRVPILIHGGRGLPPISDALSRLVDANEGAQLIIAHAGIADLGALADRFAGHPGVFWDTSVWSPIDLLDFFHRVGAEQVLFASDYPYGQQPASLLIVLRTAALAGLDQDDLRNVLSGNAERIAAGEPPLEPRPAKGDRTFSQPLTFARIHQYLSMATPLLWTRQPDTIGALGLALNACLERDGIEHEAEREQMRRLLEAARDLWRTLPELDDEGDKRTATRATFRLVHLADIVAVTSGA